MITQDFINGYVQALDNIDSAIGSLMNESIQKNPRNTCPINAFQKVRDFVLQTRNNYKELVKELNETQSKKTKT